MWIDKKSFVQLLKLRDEFEVSEYVETGTFKGINAEYQSRFFDAVQTVESNQEYFEHSKKALSKFSNVHLTFQPSDVFLKNFKQKYLNYGRTDNVIFFLDAHFYNKNAKPEDRWNVKKELRALENFKKGIIIIHDFGCDGLGRLIYDGEHLDFNLIKEEINKVNPDFYYYHNTMIGCDIITREEIVRLNLSQPLVALDNLDYAYSSPDKTYRGILYATPKKLDLSCYDLVKN